jgi:hypothetical protein
MNSSRSFLTDFPSIGGTTASWSDDDRMAELAKQDLAAVEEKVKDLKLKSKAIQAELREARRDLEQIPKAKKWFGEEGERYRYIDKRGCRCIWWPWPGERWYIETYLGLPRHTVKGVAIHLSKPVSTINQYLRAHGIDFKKRREIYLAVLAEEQAKIPKCSNRKVRLLPTKYLEAARNQAIWRCQEVEFSKADQCAVPLDFVKPDQPCRAMY